MAGKSRTVIAALLLSAITLALGLAAAPQLHDQLHHSAAPTHQCAATLFSSGTVEHSAAEPTPGAPELAPLRPSRPAANWPRIVVRPSVSLLEHAPPAQS